MSIYASLDIHEQRADAERKGCEIVQPKPNELFLDLDSAADRAVFDKQLAILKRHYVVKWVNVRPSKSGGERRHAVVTLQNPVDEKTRIFLQALLGSDRTRELLGFIRLDRNLPALPNIFFEPKSKSVRRRLLDLAIEWWLS